MKVVIGPCIGGFALSRAALDYMIFRGHAGAAAELAFHQEMVEDGWPTVDVEFYCSNIKRNDPLLVEAVETLGSEAFGQDAELRILEIPDGTEYVICSDETMAEHIAELHRTWYCDNAAESPNSTYMSDKTRVVTKQPMQPVVADERHILRFKQNAIVRHLLDHGGINMNDIAVMDFSDEDRAQFAQLIGYSLCGFSELSYASEEIVEAAMRQADKIIRAGATSDVETPGFKGPPEGWGTGWSAGTLTSIPEGSVLLDGCPVPEDCIDHKAGIVTIPLEEDTDGDSDREFKVWLDSGANHQSCYEQQVSLSDLGMTNAAWESLPEEDKESLMRDIAFDRSDWGWCEITKDEDND